MVRRALIGVVLALVVTGAGGSPASADNPPPPISPPGVTPPPEPSDPPATGPVYVITPGVGGSELPAPADQQAVEQAKQADKARSARSARPTHPARPTGSAAGTRSPSPTPVPAATSGPRPGTEVAGPQTPLALPPAAGEDVGLGLRGFAALVTMLVLFEITAVGRYLSRRRRSVLTGP